MCIKRHFIVRLPVFVFWLAALSRKHCSTVLYRERPPQGYTHARSGFANPEILHQEFKLSVVPGEKHVQRYNFANGLSVSRRLPPCDRGIFSSSQLPAVSVPIAPDATLTIYPGTLAMFLTEMSEPECHVHGGCVLQKLQKFQQLPKVN